MQIVNIFVKKIIIIIYLEIGLRGSVSGVIKYTAMLHPQKTNFIKTRGWQL